MDALLPPLSSISSWYSVALSAAARFLPVTGGGDKPSSDMVPDVGMLSSAARFLPDTGGGKSSSDMIPDPEAGGNAVPDPGAGGTPEFSERGTDGEDFTAASVASTPPLRFVGAWAGKSPTY